MPEIEKSCLIVVDVQGKLALLMHDKKSLFKNIQILIESAKILDIPILWCQQVPEALGSTVPEIAELLEDNEPINKASFSCCGCEQFISKLEEQAKKQVLLCGIETHICIYQTAVDLHSRGYDVTVVADAVSSRTEENKQIAVAGMRTAGIDIAGTEMVLFELLKTAEHPKFKQIARLVK